MSASVVEVLAVATDAPVGAIFTTRAGGVSRGPWEGLNLATHTNDDRAAVRENRRRLCAALDLDAAAVTMLDQVHGDRVLTIAAPHRPGRFLGGLEPWPAADGLVTSAVGVPLLVQGADCLPVLLWRRSDGGAVGAAHAGWRGLVGGVLERTVAALGGGVGLAAAIGPGIGPCCYRVSAPVRDAFAAAHGEAVVVGEAVDLALAARAALEAAGVAAGAIGRVEACTSCRPERFYSHRRQGAASGRQGGLIWRRPG